MYEEEDTAWRVVYWGGDTKSTWRFPKPPATDTEEGREEEDECRKLRSLRGKRPRNYDSFIDRGANLGLADTDVRLINSVTVADDNKSEPLHSFRSILIQSWSHLYIISRTLTKSTYDSLTDRGASRGLAGTDMRLIEYDDDCTIDVQGIDNHQVPHYG